MNELYYFLFLLFIIANGFGNSSSAEMDDSKKSTNQTNLPIIPPLKVGDRTFYIETFFQANWFRAGQFCRLHGMHLASINDQVENGRLGEALSSFNLTQDFWTSGNDLDQQMSFVWQSTGNSFTFTSWRPAEPDNFINSNNDTQDCVIFGNINMFAGWDDEYCSNEYYFICES